MTDKKEKPDNSKSATNEPWKHPGQSSQQPGMKLPPKVERTNKNNETA